MTYGLLELDRSGLPVLGSKLLPNVVLLRSRRRSNTLRRILVECDNVGDGLRMSSLLLLRDSRVREKLLPFFRQSLRSPSDVSDERRGGCKMRRTVNSPVSELNPTWVRCTGSYGVEISTFLFVLVKTSARGTHTRQYTFSIRESRKGAGDSQRKDPKTFLIVLPFSFPPALLSPLSLPTVPGGLRLAAGESHPAALAFHSLPPTPGDVTPAGPPQPAPVAPRGATGSSCSVRLLVVDAGASFPREYDASPLLAEPAEVDWKMGGENVEDEEGR